MFLCKHISLLSMMLGLVLILSSREAGAQVLGNAVGASSSRSSGSGCLDVTVGIGGNIGPISISAGPSITFSICPPKCVKISSGGRPYGSYNCPPDSASPGRCPARGSPCKDTCRDVIAAAAAGHKP